MANPRPTQRVIDETDEHHSHISKDDFFKAPNWEDDVKDQVPYDRNIPQNQQNQQNQQNPQHVDFGSKDRPEIARPPSYVRVDSKINLDKGKSIVVESVETDQSSQGLSNVHVGELVGKATAAISALASLHMLYDQYRGMTNKPIDESRSGYANRGQHAPNNEPLPHAQIGMGPQSIMNVVKSNPALLGSIISTAQEAYRVVTDLKNSGAKSINSAVVDEDGGQLQYPSGQYPTERQQHPLTEQHQGELPQSNQTKSLDLNSVATMLEGLLNTSTPAEHVPRHDEVQGNVGGNNVAGIMNFIDGIGSMLGQNVLNQHNRQYQYDPHQHHSQNQQPQPPPPQHQQQQQTPALSGLMGTLGAAAINAFGKGVMDVNNNQNENNLQKDGNIHDQHQFARSQHDDDRRYSNDRRYSDDRRGSDTSRYDDGRRHDNGHRYDEQIVPDQTQPQQQQGADFASTLNGLAAGLQGLASLANTFGR
jgi:hypothetical protein